MSQPHPASLSAFALRSALMTVAVSLLLGTFGPFGTYESMDWPIRYGFWFVCMLAGTCIHLPAYLLGQWISAPRNIPAWVWVPASALVAALPMTLMVNGISAAFFPGGALDDVLALYPYVAAVSVPVLAVTYFAFGAQLRLTQPARLAPQPETPPAPDSAPAPKPEPVKGETPLLDSVPGRLGRDVLCLQMEDHYVRVHTALGDVMLHGTMAEFESELVGRIDGLKVHRSWWVARKAVASWSREDKTLTLTLSNGLAVPVARDRQADVKAAGWLV